MPPLFECSASITIIATKGVRCTPFLTIPLAEFSDSQYSFNKMMATTSPRSLAFSVVSSAENPFAGKKQFVNPEYAKHVGDSAKDFENKNEIDLQKKGALNSIQ